MTSQAVELEGRLGRAFLELEGLADGFIEATHPDDEMLLAAREAPAGRARVQYTRDGLEVVLALDNLLAANGRQLPDLGRVLEVACGYGRVTRHLVRAVGPDRITATEILAPAVDFVTETFGVEGLLSPADPGELALDPGFDLIVVSSLFSHLPRHRFVAWLRALHALLAPDGLLVFSVHAPDVLPEVRKDPSGFTFVARSESRELDVAEYGSTFARPDVVEALARESGIEHLHGVRRELWLLQDLYVASRGPFPGLDGWTNTSFVRGVIDRVLTENGEFHIEGWAAESRPDDHVTDVRLLMDGQDRGGVVPAVPRADVARHWNRPDWGACGWSLHGRLPEVAPGRHVLAARGVSSSGRSQVFDVQELVLP